MTIKDIAMRIKKLREEDPVEVAREVLADANIGEHTVYKPTSKWQSILANLGLGGLESKAVCLTCYSADGLIFERVKSALKKKFKTVFSAQVDDLGFRRVFAVADSADEEPQMLICCNYYENSREEVKAMYSDSADTDDAEDIELDSDSSDPFA